MQKVLTPLVIFAFNGTIPTSNFIMYRIMKISSNLHCPKTIKQGMLKGYYL
jgi:hypothetical protein